MRYRALFLAALTASCGSFDGTLVERFTNTPPLWIDPEAYSVLAHMPAGLDVPDEGAVLHVAAQRRDTHASSQEAYVLQRDQKNEGTLGFRVAPADLPRLRAQQALIRQWSDEQDGEGQIHFSVDVNACQIGAGPEPDARISVSLVSGEDGSVREIVPSRAVRDVVLTGGSGQVALPLCP